MSKSLKTCLFNGENIKIQNGVAKPVGGPEGSIVLYTMGNPVHEDGTPVKVGDRHPFKGYMLTFERVIFPNEIDLALAHNIHFVFDNGDTFNGVANCLSTYANTNVGIKHKAYENIFFMVSTKESYLEIKKAED